jgi:isoquinoline 1-oxidoreductase subunit beta
MKRRGFLAAGATTVLLTGCAGLPVIPKRPLPQPDDAAGWVRYDAGRWTLRLPRAEMGQHIDSALAAIACEELGIAPEALVLERPSTAQVGPVRATVGSESVALFALPLAQACATLRDAVAAGRSGTLPVQPRAVAELRAFAPGARWVGRGLPHPLLPALLRGEPAFAADVRRPGRCFGRVLRAPASPGLPSRPLTWNEAAARAVPGFVALVQDPLLRHGEAEGLGLLAETPGALDRIEAALAPRWQVEGGFEAADIEGAIDVDAALAAGSLAHRVHDDRLPDPGVPWDVDLRIDVAAAPHAAIEPRCAVAEWSGDGGLQVWCGTQDAFYVRAVLGKRLGLDEQRVVVHGQRLGGAFGGRTVCTVELEAAVLARAAGRPVKLQWTRADEWRHGFHRPPVSHRVRARLAGGRLAAWWHAFASAPILLTNAAVPAWMHPVTRLIGDGGTARGAALPYAVPARRTEYALRRLPVFVGPWRGLGAGPNGLAVESAIDECARRTGQDALAFRLAHLENDPRLAAVLKRVAAMAAWGDAAAAGRHLGIACGIYKETSRAAVVAEVAARAGRWRVTGLWCAWEGGRVVLPDAVRAQCEGNLVWGLGMVFGAPLPLAGGDIPARGLVEAALPKLSEVPPMKVELLESDAAPAGAGETAIVAAAAAIANALRAASGVRPIRFPLAADDPAASSGAG